MLGGQSEKFPFTAPGEHLYSAEGKSGKGIKASHDPGREAIDSWLKEQMMKERFDAIAAYARTLPGCLLGRSNSKIRVQTNRAASGNRHVA